LIVLDWIYTSLEMQCAHVELSKIFVIYTFGGICFQHFGGIMYPSRQREEHLLFGNAICAEIMLFYFHLSEFLFALISYEIFTIHN